MLWKKNAKTIASLIYLVKFHVAYNASSVAISVSLIFQGFFLHKVVLTE